MNHTPASLAQRLAIVDAVAERRRNATHCSKGHSEWRRRSNGRRFCIRCKLEKQRIRRGKKSGRLKYAYGLYKIDIEVTELSARGLSAAQIAMKLHYTKGGIVRARERARHKLGAKDLYETITLVYARGVIE